ncbi:hypothetical protein [Pseudophaeobacter leonis]|uniref:hypothetical protein n=1 Tax=Pseudophaeobacter leonis TaxID=1144477 RepID=UPI001F4E9EF8|nr:hypothetical protein [Pseudophaeobacter leonis]
MDAKEQAEGERRVKEQLKRLGLAKPSSLTVAQFDAMVADLSGKLAYMSPLNLQALAEQVANMPGGKERDRFPIAAKILGWAAEIQPPADDASPLFRAVFAHALGQRALVEGWAPELLGELRRARVWPRDYDLRLVQERAAEARRRIARLNEQLRRGDVLSSQDRTFRQRRDQAGGQMPTHCGPGSGDLGMKDFVVIVAPDGAARLEAEAARVAVAKARGAVPEECGDAIPNAPARGAFRVFQPTRLYPDGGDGYVAKPAGYRGRSAIQRADVFDRMAASSARSKKLMPLTPAQVAMGRHYRDLVERHACAGLKCSSIEAIRSGGSGRGGDFMDAVLRDREEIERLRLRIGTRSAMVVRRIRPSKRRSRTSIRDRRLVDMVCLEDLGVTEALKAHGWSVYGLTVQAASKALGQALERMSSR